MQWILTLSVGTDRDWGTVEAAGRSRPASPYHPRTRYVRCLSTDKYLGTDTEVSLQGPRARGARAVARPPVVQPLTPSHLWRAGQREKFLHSHWVSSPGFLRRDPARSDHLEASASPRADIPRFYPYPRS